MFEVGDICLAYGCKCEVVSVDERDYLSVKVRIKEGIGTEMRFTKEGLREGWHKEPSLKIFKKANENFRMTLLPYLDEYGELRWATKDCGDSWSWNKVKNLDSVIVEFEK